MNKSLFIAAISVVAVSHAEAQQPNFQGNWNCETIIMKQARNQSPFSMQHNFQLDIQAGGLATFSGTEITPAGYFPFSGQGQWQFNGADLNIAGQMQGGSAQTIAMQSGFPIPPGSDQFFFATKPQTQSYMAADEQRGNKKSGVWRIATQCRR